MSLSDERRHRILKYRSKEYFQENSAYDSFYYLRISCRCFLRETLNTTATYLLFQQFSRHAVLPSWLKTPDHLKRRELQTRIV
jgi:hypothetical protein